MNIQNSSVHRIAPWLFYCEMNFDLFLHFNKYAKSFRIWKDVISMFGSDQICVESDYINKAESRISRIKKKEGKGGRVLLENYFQKGILFSSPLLQMEKWNMGLVGAGGSKNLLKVAEPVRLVQLESAVPLFNTFTRGSGHKFNITVT